VKHQPNYSGQKLRVMCDEPDWFILYGSNGMAGIAGYGETPEEAIQDFKNSWKYFNGEEWIKKNLHTE